MKAKNLNQSIKDHYPLSGGASIIREMGANKLKLLA